MNQALRLVYPSIKGILRVNQASRHLVVVVTTTNCQPNPFWHTASFGCQREWKLPHAEIATSRAETSADTGLGSAEFSPFHLREKGAMCLYVGSAVQERIVVACSSPLRPYWDEMFSKWTVAAILAIMKQQLAEVSNASKSK
jgi:hypothetical protein